jgi:hypothetical protein
LRTRTLCPCPDRSAGVLARLYSRNRLCAICRLGVGLGLGLGLRLRLGLALG